MQETVKTNMQSGDAGSDADPRNDPTYPMRHRVTGDGEERTTWPRPTQQSADVEILQSNERPNLTAVFGTSTPPAGLSGILRRFAFRYSESSYVHWLPLVAADRLGVVEGLLDDLRRGRVPNVLAELGYAAEWKYNKASLARRLFIALALSAGAGQLLRARRTTQPAEPTEVRVDIVEATI